jgi:hypothetical protein
MKKLLLTLLMATTAISLLHAQKTKMGMHRLGYSNVLPDVDTILESYAVQPSEIEDAHQEIVKDFSRRCKASATGRWYKMPKGGFAVKFTMGDAWYRIDYNAKGDWVTTVRIHSEPQLPETVKNKVDYAYSGYTITRVEEVDYVKNIDTTYVIHLKDKDVVKVVCVCNGRMETLEDTASK